MHCDCLIVGGGPAGATAAALLASWGRDVVLVHRAGPETGVAEETIVPRARERIERLGLFDIFERNAFFGTPRHGRVWNVASVELSDLRDDERGFKVDRPTFDAELRAFAATRGARVREDLRVVGPLDDPDGIRISAEGGEERIRARTTLCATGRSTTETLAHTTVTQELVPTLALSTRASNLGEYADATVIEAVREGWLWWLPSKRGDASLTLFADRDEVTERGREDVFRSALAGALGPARTLTQAPDRGTIATPRLRRARSSTMLVGDAASVIDPLSSQGIEKALSSAEDAAICVETVLDRPETAARVFDYRRVWEERLYRAHAEQTLSFYEAETRFGDAPFWRARRRSETAEAPRELPARLSIHPDVLRATVLRPAGRLLEEHEGFIVAGDPLDRIGDLPLTATFRLIQGTSDRETIHRNAARSPEFSAVTPRGLDAALLELLRLGFLVEG